jgi:hypothetical protein
MIIPMPNNMKLSMIFSVNDIFRMNNLLQIKTSKLSKNFLLEK